MGDAHGVTLMGHPLLLTLMGHPLLRRRSWRRSWDTHSCGSHLALLDAHDAHGTPTLVGPIWRCSGGCPIWRQSHLAPPSDANSGGRPIGPPASGTDPPRGHLERHQFRDGGPARPRRPCCARWPRNTRSCCRERSTQRHQPLVSAILRRTDPSRRPGNLPGLRQASILWATEIVSRAHEEHHRVG